MASKRIFIKILLLTCILACSRVSNPDIDRGAVYSYEDGFPEIRVSAIGYLSPAGQAYINITTDIVYSSLIYRASNGSNLAAISVVTMVTGKDAGSTYSSTNRERLSIERRDERFARSLEVRTIENEVYVPSGRYHVAVTVTDEATGKQTLRETEAFIPDPDYQGVNLTSVRLLGMDMDLDAPRYLPITTYDVPSRHDSLLFTFQVMNNRQNMPLNITSRLLKFDSDSAPAIPMSYLNHSASSLQHKGIDYSQYEVLHNIPRVIDPSGTVNIDFQTPLPGTGNYRFEVFSDDLDKRQFYKARDFSIKPENYPTLRSPRELAEPLVYLMDRRDHERLMAISDPDSMKLAIDQFWLSNIRNTNETRSVIEKFYNRVEEANKQFSNHKEGWKTDLGMIHILFGEPWYVEQRLRRLYWSFSYDRTDPRRNFFFEAPRIRNEFFPFDHYILARHRDYYNVQYQQTQLWLTGQILRTNL